MKEQTPIHCPKCKELMEREYAEGDWHYSCKCGYEEIRRKRFM